MPLDGDTEFHKLFDDYTPPPKPEHLGTISRRRGQLSSGLYPPSAPNESRPV